MDAVIDQIERSCAVAFGLGVEPKPVSEPRKKRLSTVERYEIINRENANYELQVGDGVCLASHGNRRGVIRSINAKRAEVGWFLPTGGIEVETLWLRQLDYMPTLEQIYGKDPNDPHTVRDDKCITAQIQSEWSPQEERQRNCYPVSHAKVPTTEFGNRSSNRSIH